MPVATEQGFEFLLADSRVLHGWALAAQGPEADALAEVRAGMTAYQATGAVMSRPAHLTLLGRVHGRAGRTDEALAAVAAALSTALETGERTYEAELYRLKGELTLAPSSVPGLASSVQQEAEACFRKALDIARRQQAKSLELRAAVSLARLWQHQGKRSEAHQLLSEVYGWFTEGFDTKDLQEAQALLDQLAVSLA